MPDVLAEIRRIAESCLYDETADRQYALEQVLALASGALSMASEGVVTGYVKRNDHLPSVPGDKFIGSFKDGPSQAVEVIASPHGNGVIYVFTDGARVHDSAADTIVWVVTENGIDTPFSWRETVEG